MASPTQHPRGHHHLQGMTKKITTRRWLEKLLLHRWKRGDSFEDLDALRERSSHKKIENLLGLLRVRVIRGINLAIRDLATSDPYVTVRMGDQKLKTRIIYRSMNPEWNEDLTLSIADPNLPIKLSVYDHDTFTKDDRMGEAEFDIKDFIDALRMDQDGVPSGTIMTKIIPSRYNCLAEESHIVWVNGKVVQNMCFRLKNVERGELEIQLLWIDLPGSKGLKGLEYLPGSKGLEGLEDLPHSKGLESPSAPLEH